MIDIDLTIPPVMQPMMFIGVFDKLPDKAQYGDLCIVGGNEYVWCSDGWIDMGNKSPEYNPPKIHYPSNCKNCGAVLIGHICEYCGTNNEV